MDCRGDRKHKYFKIGMMINDVKDETNKNIRITRSTPATP